MPHTLDKRIMLRLIAEHLTDPDMRRLYLLHLYGDAKRHIPPGLSAYALAKRLNQPRTTVGRYLRRAADIMDPLIEQAHKNGVRLVCKGVDPDAAKLLYQDELTQGVVVWDKTDATECCAIEGVDPYFFAVARWES